MNEAISAYQRITVSPEFRELERQRSLARHDEATALYYARQEGMEKGREEVARNALAEGVPIELIKKISGLDEEALKHNQARFPY